ncbi:hypothetical protein YC2023_110614 [Brassica napus]
MVPHFDNSALIKTYARTLIGRCMNPAEQEMPALLQNIPKIWKLEDRVVGTDLGHGKFQFDFQTEEEIEAVLKLQPYHFDYWMLAIARWQPRKSQLFPSEIPFWVRVRGVPMEFKTLPTFESIGGALGRLISVDLELSRVHVVVDGFQQLCLETTVDFKGGEFYDGEEVTITLRYEKLFGFCSICASLCHKDEKCPLAPPAVKQSPEKKREKRDGNSGWFEGGKHEERARSYKGVVINGNAGNQQKERDGREYYGKGKGKMVEENDNKWRRVAEKGNKNSINNRGTYRGDGEGSRQRMPRREDERGVAQEERSRGIPGKATGQAGDQLVKRGPCVEEREEGELQCSEAKQEAPSLEFQEELAKTQAIGAAVISDPMDTENGLQAVNSLIGNVNEVEDGGDTYRIMDMDEIRAVFLEHGVDMDAADLEECSEGEMAEALRELEQASGEDNREVEQVTNVEAEKDMADGDVGKKNGSRKRLFKPTISTAASTKMRLAKALVSPRKRAVGKTGTRHGEPGKQMENKGPSIPKLGPPKP